MGKNSKKITILIIIVIIGGIFLISKMGSESSLISDVDKTKLSQAPTFSLEDYDGNIVSSSDFVDKILVVNSWAVWCPFCVNELPDFKELQEEFPDDIAVIAINRRESRSLAKNYTDDAGLTESYRFLLDPGDSFYKSIGGFSMPETIFVSPEGELLKHKRGPLDFTEMKSIIDELLAKN